MIVEFEAVEKRYGRVMALRNADLAMYHAKKHGRNNFQFFETSMNESVVERTTLAHALRLAVERNELKLHYQPIFDSETREIVARAETTLELDSRGLAVVDSDGRADSAKRAVQRQRGGSVFSESSQSQESAARWHRWPDRRTVA